MITVKLTCNADLPKYPFVRQTPGRSGIWGDCQFFVNTPLTECDWWIVMDDLPWTESVLCSPTNTIFFNGEPPSVKIYDERFLKQFATIVTCQDTQHPNAIHTQQSLFWSHQYLEENAPADSDIVRRGYQDYDQLSRHEPLEKTANLSLIASSKSFTPGHRRRLEFAQCLKERMGDRLDVYGRGIRSFEDKWQVVAPYKYHIALENSSYKDYWTEKLSDPLLFDSYPFYFGCPNVFDYFPQEALTVIDISDIDASLEAIQSGIQANLYEKSLSARRQAKDLILNRYNLFPAVASMIAQSPSPGTFSKSTVTLKPHSLFQHSLLSRSRRALERLIKVTKN